jgi:virginiamycin B lyase
MIWFVDSGGSVGNITMDGQVYEQLLPTTNSEPFCLTEGPDGNLWITELGANRIAKVIPHVMSVSINVAVTVNPGAVPPATQGPHVGPPSPEGESFGQALREGDPIRAIQALRNRPTPLRRPRPASRSS